MEEKNFLSKCHLVERDCDEWKVLEFKLQLSLGTTAVVINKIHNISNTHVGSSFSSYAKGSIVLESFIETDKLTESNKLEKIVSKGFEIGENGMIFNVGFNKNIDIKAERPFSVVMCKLAVGKSYCYADYKYKEKPIECQQGFDSVYLYSEDTDPQIFFHKYILFKNYQIYPYYLIDFSIDKFKQKFNKTPLCENCIKAVPNQAKLYCKNENADFCYDCDQEYHSTKVGMKHERIDINEKPKNFGMCLKHEDNRLELYCTVCCQSLCINCKISGDHAVGQNAKHKLLKLKDAYQDIGGKVKEIDPNIDRRKNQLTEDLSNIDLKIKEVNSQATHVQEQIYAIFHKALKQLHVQTQKKLSFLIGDQLELKRQYDHIQWLESFLKYSLQVQEPHQFLKSWYKYSKYKKQVLSLSNLAINTEVKADLKLEGNIFIICEEKNKKQLNIANNHKQMNIPTLQAIDTPVKGGGDKLLSEKDVGSTSLRKTVFKNHYGEKMKSPGTQPNFAKGNYDIQMPGSNLQAKDNN